MDINEVNCQLDMCIRHFEAVKEQCRQAAARYPDTSWEHFHKGKACIAEEAVDWITEAKKNIAK
jgi:hypothetical protein